MTETRFHALPDGRAIACRHTPAPAGGATVVFLPGYMSDMEGSKATALFEAAREEGRGCLLLDYSGCGQSPGDFAQGTLSRWRDEVVAVVAARVPGPVVLVGSSMGGWLMLLVARALGAQVAALVGIAAAPDFTEWGYSEAEKARLATGETVLHENPYGPEATPTHALFWADGQAQRQLDGPIAFEGPVRLIHGQQDGDVPWDISLRLSVTLLSSDVQLTLVKGGDHRLSRPADIALIRGVVAQLADGCS